MPSTSPSSRRPEFRFFKHRDFDLIREVPTALQFDILHPDDGTWQRIIMNPFTASMAEISEAQAAALAGGADLYAPITAREVRPGVVEPA